MPAQKSKRLTGFEVLQYASKNGIKGVLLTTHRTGAETREYLINDVKYKVRAWYTMHNF